MNTAITPFAMRCTQEQFDDVKEELAVYRRIYMIYDFNRYPVLLSDKNGVTNTGEWYCDDNSLPLLDWDKELFLKMAGKPDAESRELLGYKRNPEFDITYKDIGALLRAEFYDFHISDIWEIEDCKGAGSEFFRRALQLGIVGEGKWLVPVYREDETEPELSVVDQLRKMGIIVDTSVSLRHLTYEQQKGGVG